MKAEILRADLRWRRIVIVVLAVAVCATAALFESAHRHLAALSAAAPSPQSLAQLRLWTGLTMTGSGLCLLALAAFAAMLARRTLAQQRWPPTPMRVIRDTTVRRGEQATRIAHGLNVAACSLTAIALMTAIAGWLLFGTR